MKSWFAQIRQLKLILLVATIVCVCLFALIPNRLYTSFEQSSYDRLVAWTGEQNIDNRVVLVDIDETTLSQVGAWPWPREKIANLLDILLNYYQVAVLGVDIVFPDKKEGDEQLAKLLNHSSVVMSQVLDFSDQSKNQTGSLMTHPMQVQDVVPEIHGYIANHGNLLTNYSRVGHISPIIDEDGKVRRIYPLACHVEGCTDILSLQMYQALHAGLNAEITLKDHLLTLNFYEADKTELVLDQNNALLIPFRVKPDGFKYISASAVISQEAPLHQLKNTVVVLGSTALGLGDFVATPARNIVPGLELHAQIFSSILDNNFIQPKQRWWWIVLPQLFIALLFMLLPTRSSRANIVWTVGMLLLTLLIELAAFRYLNWWVPATPALISIMLLGLTAILQDNILVNRRLAAVAEQIGRFIPDALAKRLVRGRDFEPNTEERELTVLVADMRGFTSAAEGKTPDQVASLAQKCLETLTQVVYRFGGTIEKFSGDGLMAIWGAPRKDAEHAQHAYQAGLAMQLEIQQLQAWFLQNHFPKMKVSVGINTGKMAVGVFGGHSHLAWSAHGDAVNVASRIEQLTRTVGTDLLLGARTAELVGLEQLSYCGDFKVKGRNELVAVYRPLDSVIHLE